MSTYSSLAAVERTFIVIEALAKEVNGLSVSELENRTKLSKSMISRILSTLKEGHYVEQDPDTRFYRLSFEFLSIAFRYFDALNLEGIFLPIMQKITQKTKQLVQLAVVKNESIYFIQKVEGDSNLRVATMVGKKAPYHATAVGKVWLASLDEQTVIRITSKYGLKAYTENTITDIYELLKDLEKTRQQGYAVANEEINKNVIAVAVPIYESKHSKRVIASIVVAGASVEMSSAKIEKIANLVKDHVSTLYQFPLSSFGLGFSGIDNQSQQESNFF